MTDHIIYTVRCCAPCVQIVCGSTAHPALAKACFYFGIKMVVTAVDPHTQRMDVDAVRRATTARTIAIYASAPTFPAGVVDPIPELGAWALERQLGLHVDNCLGGFYLSFAQREGLLPSVPMWNFSVRCDAPSVRLRLLLMR
jgi:sphinganine-1-phosphate aldolase